MANLLSGMAIHFNRKFYRTGALFARRFHRRLLKSKKELDLVVASMNDMDALHRYRKYWMVNVKKAKKVFKTGHSGKREWKGMWERSARKFYKNRLKTHPLSGSFVRADEIELRGQFDTLPPMTIYIENVNLSAKISIKKSP